MLARVVKKLFETILTKTLPLALASGAPSHNTAFYLDVLGFSLENTASILASDALSDNTAFVFGARGPKNTAFWVSES
jgi:hypothetical protein